jgi:hypothetical protein
VQRARFNEQQQQIQQDREQTAEVLNEVQGHLGEQFVVAQQNPDRQAFVPEQRALADQIEPASTGGQENTGDYANQTIANMGGTAQPVPIPTQPRRDVFDDNEQK